MSARPRFEFAEINRTVYGKYQDGSFYDCLCGLEQTYAHEAGAFRSKPLATPNISRNRLRALFAKMVSGAARPRHAKA